MIRNMVNLKSGLQRDAESNETLVIRVTGFQRTVSSSENTVSRNGCAWQLHDPLRLRNATSRALYLPTYSRFDLSYSNRESCSPLPSKRQRSSRNTTSRAVCLPTDSRFDLSYSNPESCSPLPRKPSSRPEENGLVRKRNGDADFPGCYGFTMKHNSPIHIQHTPEDTPSSNRNSCPENGENFLVAKSPEPDSIIPVSINDQTSESDDGAGDISEGYDHCSDARFKGSSLADSLQSKVAIFCSSDGFEPHQDSSCANGQVSAEANGDFSDSRSKASSSASLHSKLQSSDLWMPQQGSATGTSLGCTSNSLFKSTSTSLQNKDKAKENSTDAIKDCSRDPQDSGFFEDLIDESYNANVPISDSQSKAYCSGTQFNCERPPPHLPVSFKHSFTDINKRSKLRSSNNTHKARFKSLSSATSLQSSDAVNKHITGVDDVCSQEPQDEGHYHPATASDFIVDDIGVQDGSDPKRTLPNQDSVRSSTNVIEQPLSVLSESPGPSNEHWLETSAVYRKRKFESSNHGSNVDEPSLKKAMKKRSLPEETVTSPVTETGAEPDPSIPEVPCCQIPFNGHREDSHHFNSCNIVLAGIILRGEHRRWLTAIPINISVIRSILNNSCKRILLSGKCTKVRCAFKHAADLNFNFPSNQLMDNVSMFTKWFLENASNPEFRGILLVLSRLPKDHDDTLMVVFSYVKMISKLANKIYRQALGIKLVEILVNMMDLEPWEAVRTLLMFSVTQTTTQPEIEEMLSSLEVTNKCQNQQFRLFESVTVLWHISGVFVCPRDLLFKLVKECVVQMPSDLKLLKDKLIADLMLLPRLVIQKEFLLVDKFLTKFYPQNSEVAHVVRSCVLYRTDPTSVPRTAFYETSRVKGTGPINRAWDHWDVRGSRISSFELVLRRTRKSRRSDEFRPPETPICDLFFENLLDDVRCGELYRILSKRNVMLYKSVTEESDMEPLVESLRAGKYSEVVKIITSSDSDQIEDMCFRTMQELEICDRSKLPTVVFEILRRLQGPAPDKMSAKAAFASMLNSLVMRFHREADFRSAIKLIKTMRVADVNNLEHVPENIDQETFSVLCSEVHLECRLYSEAIRFLTYKECLNFAKYDIKSVHFHLLERVVTNMFKSFLKQRLSLHAVEIFRVILKAQESLHYPIDIGRFYEGVLFLSFIRDLKKNACPPGEGASLYVLVDRLCGNNEKFASITYRSLLVELHRADSPEDVIRRTLLVCLKSRVYPDFSFFYYPSLVLNSQLTTEEMSIYLTHYFLYYIAQDNLRSLENRPFELRFFESQPPARKPFPISNDVMKTPRTVPEAVERLKSALQEVSGSIYQEMDIEYSSDCVTIPIHGVQALLEELKRR